MTPIPTNSVIVRSGVMRTLGVYTAPPEYVFARLGIVIIRTDRGLEYGTALTPATPHAINAAEGLARGTLVRSADDDDAKRIDQLKMIQREQYAKAEELIREHHLPMELVDCEHLFGGERVVFYFLSESRVDFRELVKSLARAFQARIELRQIGVRDEAKLLADYGDCGKPVCCNTHLAVMPPVSMRMAKLQKSTLDPTKIAGRCGRLKCCLRYENDVYEEFLAELPAVGVRVVTATGPGRVLAQEVLARKLLIVFDDGRRLPVPAADVLSVIG